MRRTEISPAHLPTLQQHGRRAGFALQIFADPTFPVEPLNPGAPLLRFPGQVMQTFLPYTLVSSTLLRRFHFLTYFSPHKVVLLDHR